MDRATNVEDKISLFEINNMDVTVTDGVVDLSVYNIYKLGAVHVKYHNYMQSYAIGVGNTVHKGFKNAEEVTYKQLALYTTAPLTASAGLAGPYYTKYQTPGSQLNIQIFPFPNSSNLHETKISYIENITAPNWTYNIVGTSALHNPSDQNFRNFQLHSSEESLLVVKILQLAGISIKDYQLSKAAVQEEVKIKQEKQ